MKTINSFTELVFHRFSELNQIMKGSEKYQTSCMAECGAGKEEQEKAMKFRLSYLQPAYI